MRVCLGFFLTIRRNLLLVQDAVESWEHAVSQTSDGAAVCEAEFIENISTWHLHLRECQ
jgi:hypothetical protein